MAINPPTDVIADVIKAADPRRAAMAEARLKSLASAPVGGSFADVVERKVVQADVGAADLRVRTPQRVAASASDPLQKRKQALVEFEAAILGSMVQELIPKAHSSIRGAAGAGADSDVWRSMLSNEIARKIAKSGVLKIQEHLFRTHPLAIGSEGTVARATQTSSANLSDPLRNGPASIASGAGRGRRA